jgi:glycosyltransferase involved in cell wall biosynthesis
MLPRAGFFPALLEAFASVPDLFCATAQIYFPPGVRREETGKAVLQQLDSTDFPVRYDLPISGENLSYVLYGSGGCSLYSAEKIRALGGLNEIYEPAYVEDLDVCYRAWLRAWPSVFVAGACVEHRHRATTSRYYSQAQLEVMLEKNYLRFLCHAANSPGVFHRLWQHDIKRLRQLAIEGKEPARQALACAWSEPSRSRFRETTAYSEEHILALVSGDVAVFPGRRRRDRPVVLIATPYLPFPLAHGGAVRIFNLMERAARDFDHVLVSFADSLDTPPGELLDFCTEIVLVRRTGSHSRPRTMRPDVVEEYDSLAFRAALEQSIRKWRPEIAQLEYTQMAQYAQDCAPVPSVLVEHDITFDLQEQLLREVENDPGASWELRRELERWRRFETTAWHSVDCVIAMSEEDRKKITGTRAVCVPNGVALDRFQPSHRATESGRMLFIGSFGHLPNLLGVEFLLSKVWPLLQALSPTLHIIAGAKHEYFLDHFRHRVNLRLDRPGVELEGFVADVRAAYARATIVIAPLIVSAGTNIKILEAMAMGKAIVTTPAGVRGLHVTGGEDLIVTESPEEMADAIRVLLQDPGRRRTLEFNARQTARREYDWDAIALRQRDIYRSLCGGYSKGTAITSAGERRASA